MRIVRDLFLLSVVAAGVLVSTGTLSWTRPNPTEAEIVEFWLRARSTAERSDLDVSFEGLEGQDRIIATWLCDGESMITSFTVLSRAQSSSNVKELNLVRKSMGAWESFVVTIDLRERVIDELAGLVESPETFDPAYFVHRRYEIPWSWSQLLSGVQFDT